MKKIKTVAEVSVITAFVFFISAEIIAETREEEREKRKL